jgi:hypothetical protein
VTTNGHIRQFWVPLGTAVTFGDRVGSAAPVSDEFAGLFPPHDPLGPDLEQQDQPLVYEPPDRRGNRPPPRAFAAAPMDDDELYDRLFGPLGANGWD